MSLTTIDLKVSSITECIVPELEFRNKNNSDKWNLYNILSKEYIKLVQQYNKLVIILNNSEHKNNLLFEEIQKYQRNEKDFYKKIDDLIVENKRLKDEINILNDKINSQNDTINILSDKIINQDNIIKELCISNKNILDKLNKSEVKRLFNKYTIAIQDINRLYQLEKQIPILSKLRKTRIDECHYIDDTDISSLVDDKRTILLDKIKNIPSEIETLFNLKYPLLLSNIQNYIIQNPTFPNQQIENEINEWWE
jgi:ribosomal protein L18E